nr:MAG TPA: hypothetical protein [Caudoviricetes sp.]DAQ96331.1 MAG TPA: hypothetical protein [Caudoviricetes sp.]
MSVSAARAGISGRRTPGAMQNFTVAERRGA